MHFLVVEQAADRTRCAAGAYYNLIPGLGGRTWRRKDRRLEKEGKKVREKERKKGVGKDEGRKFERVLDTEKERIKN